MATSRGNRASKCRAVTEAGREDIQSHCKRMERGCGIFLFLFVLQNTQHVEMQMAWRRVEGGGWMVGGRSWPHLRPGV